MTPPVARSCGGSGSGDAMSNRKPPTFDLGTTYGTGGKPATSGVEIESELEWARRLVADHGADLRHVWAWQRWFCWDGRRWDPYAQDEPRRRAKKSARERTLLALDADGEALRRARQAESNRGIEATLRLAASEAQIAIKHEDFDADPFLLNVRNGTVDLRTGELRPHRCEDLITKIAPVDYDPRAAAPVWERFIAEVLPAQEVLDFVQRFCGYALTGDVGEQVLVFFYGKGANGKSTILEVLQDILGDYATQAPPDILIARRNEAHPTELTVLHGRRLACCVETQEGRRLNEVRVKLLTGSDRITARRMGEDFWTFDPTHKLILGANHKPRIQGTDEAIWRRILVVPFEVTIPPELRDPKLRAKLIAEAPGILAWLVRGWLSTQSDGLRPPDAVRAATDAYRAEEDQVEAFLREECVQGAAETVAKSVLYDAYKVWAEAGGERAVTKRALGESLLARGFKSKRDGQARTPTWVGLGVQRKEGP